MSVNVFDLTGLVLHFDASNIAGNPAIDSQVSNWNDLSGNGYNLTTRGSDPNPFLRDTGPNNQRFLQFDTNLTSLETPTIPTSVWAGASRNAHTTFFVIRRVGGGVVYFQYQFHTDATTRHSFESDRRTDFPDSNVQQTMTNPITVGTWWLVCSTCDGEVRRAYRNGVTNGTHSILDSIPPTSTMANRTDMAFRLARNHAETSSAICDYAEVAHYNRLLTEEERTAVTTHLMGKYFPIVPDPGTPS